MDISFNSLKNNPYLILSLACILCYVPFSTIGYLSDDFIFLSYYNIEGWNMIFSNFHDAFFIPLTHIVQLILLEIFNQHSFYIHLFQIFLHLFIALQLYHLTSTVLKFDLLKSLLASLFFILLPFQAECILWFSSIGYQCCLLFTLLAIKYFYKEQLIMYIIFMALAIHFKEIGYIIPLLAIGVYFLKNKNINLKFWIGSTIITIASSLLFRYMVLGEILGGYGANTHLNFEPQTIIKVIAGYIIKFFSFSRFALSEEQILLQFLIVLLLISPLLISKIKAKKYKPILLWIFFFVVCLLPVINLEITSIKSIQSDRYGYFASVPVVILFASAISHFKQNISYLISATSIVTLTIITTYDNFKWNNASQLCENYLSKLTTLDLSSKTILLLNVPDNYKGVYVLRNGVNEYLKSKNINTEISIKKYQTFFQKDGGLVLKDLKYHDYHAETYSENTIQKIGNYQNEFDQILYFKNGNFYEADKLTFVND